VGLWSAGLFVCLLLSAASAAGQAGSEAERAARGFKVLQMQGCLACHSLDGSVSAGPSFLGRFGTEVEVQVHGERRRVRFDRDYLRSSLEQPEAAVALGFAPGVMPRFALTDEQLDAVAVSLDQLAQPHPAPSNAAAKPWLMWSLAGLAALILAGGALALRRRGARRRARGSSG
jgi:mono/diheme cytochrome c family protein